MTGQAKRTVRMYTVTVDERQPDVHGTFILTGVPGNFSVVCTDCDWETQASDVRTLEQRSVVHAEQTYGASPP